MIGTWLNFPGNLQPWRELSRDSEGMNDVGHNGDPGRNVEMEA